MAVVNTKSATITALDAVPIQSVNGFKHKGPLFVCVDNAAVAADDDDGSVYRMCRVPSGARIKELNVLNDAMAGSTDYDLGVYQTLGNGGAVVDANLFCDAISMVGERKLPLNAVFEGGINITNWDTRLWEQLGLSADPYRDYDICFTANTVGSAAGDLALEVVYSL